VFLTQGSKMFPDTYMKEEEARIVVGGFFMQFLQEYLLEKIQLTCSCGVATNKLLAKVASELHKPGKVTILPKGSVQNVSNLISIDNIPGLKSKTGQKLMDTFNIQNMLQITRVKFEELEKVFGKELAKSISSWGEGTDNEPVVSKEMNDKITLNMPEHGKIINRVLGVNYIMEFFYILARVNKLSALLREIKNLNDEMKERLDEEKYRHHRTAYQIRVDVTFIMIRNETEKRSLDIDLSSAKMCQDVPQQVLEFIKKWEYFNIDSFSITEMSFTARDFQRINK
jgi:nucleotidyltransferase/DNA polymerase involved in DNA repair